MLRLLMGLLASATTPAPGPEPLNLPQWITAEDYPIEALRNMWDGRVFYALDVTPVGSVAACSIERSSGHAILDQATCDAVRSRARFAPARDRAGRPIAGRYTGSANWAIPDRGPAELVATAGRIDFDVDPDGHAHDCSSTIPRGYWPNLGDICTQFQMVSNIPPLEFTPATGSSVRHVVIRFDMKIQEAGR